MITVSLSAVFCLFHACVCVFIVPPGAHFLLCLLVPAPPLLPLFFSFGSYVVTVGCTPPTSKNSARNDVMHGVKRRRCGLWSGKSFGGGASCCGCCRAPSVTVALVRILGGLLGRRGVSHGALRLWGTLDTALVAQALARVLEERNVGQHRVTHWHSVINLASFNLVLYHSMRAAWWHSG